MNTTTALLTAALTGLSVGRITAVSTQNIHSISVPLPKGERKDDETAVRESLAILESLRAKGSQTAKFINQYSVQVDGKWVNRPCWNVTIADSEIVALFGTQTETAPVTVTADEWAEYQAFKARTQSEDVPM